MAEIEFPPGTPEEMQEYIRKQIDRQEMSIDVQRHSLTRFFEELTEDQARSLMHLLNMFESDPARVSYFQGFMVAMMQTRFHLCAACGQNHTAQMEGMAEGHDPTPRVTHIGMPHVPFVIVTEEGKEEDDDEV